MTFYTSNLEHRFRSCELHSWTANEGKPGGRYHTQLYNELEILNLRKFQKETSVKKVNPKDRSLKIKPSWWPSKAKRLLKVIKIHEKNQFNLFQKTMRILLFCGQGLGLNPVTGILENDPQKLKFKMCSFRFLYSAIIFSAQAFATIICFIRMVSEFNIFKIGFAAFCMSTCLTTYLFMRVAAKWPALMLEVTNSNLNDYVDPQIGFRCTVATVTLLSLAFLEHILAFLSKYVKVLECSPDQTEIYEAYNRNDFAWWYDMGVQYYLSIGIGLQILNVISTMNWNYSDLFIICMSMYLTSILRKIKQKVMMNANKILPPAFWSTLREDYTRATRLVRSFDDVISSVTFFSFASNLFFVCLQLFNVLSNGVSTAEHQFRASCPNYRVGPFNGHENTIYFLFSLAFILGRSVVVSLIAAGVHTESLAIGPPLYDVPSTVYCEDVQRFIEQVHSDHVALTGLQFFYVTRELVLSVAATVVTYELVLVQFGGVNVTPK